MAADRDVIIAAATASGKTEAAFLPICSTLLTTPQAEPGIKALYVSPLKALINDQYDRLDQLCDDLRVPVHRWHGDVAASRKSKLVANPDGILLITPESLEALFVTRGSAVTRIFAGLRYAVVDELHAFLGAERGAQLQSLLHRVELAIRRRVPRIGLSATIGDMRAAAGFLRPRHGDDVTIITAEGDTAELRMQLRGYEVAAAGDSADGPDEETGGERRIADHLFRTLRGADNLVFANTRGAVELYTDLLARQSSALSLPCDFLPHHGSLSKEVREYVEARLKDRDRPVTAVCTSTLEMGIDIGMVASVAQIGPPPSVSSLRQRIGRSGRRGSPATARLYIQEKQVDVRTAPQDEIRAALVQTIATVRLMLERWNEPPDPQRLHLSTLTQQLLSMIAQHGGVRPAQAYEALCTYGPFDQVTPRMFAAVLRSLGAADLIGQAGDGLLLLGLTGERIVNHYSFYAAFRSEPEYRLVNSGRTLGTITVDQAVSRGSLLIFAGRRWQVLEVDDRAKVIDLVPSSAGVVPQFASSGGGWVADRVRQEMFAIYQTSDVPAYLDQTAVELLAEGRANFARLGLASTGILPRGNETLLFPWCGDRVMATLALALSDADVHVEHAGVCLTVSGADTASVSAYLQHLTTYGLPDRLELAGRVGNKIVEKYDEYLSDDVLTEAYAQDRLDPDGARVAIREILGRLPTAIS
jgi:ATP-dependent Lhr-like helicase